MSILFFLLQLFAIALIVVALVVIFAVIVAVCFTKGDSNPPHKLRHECTIRRNGIRYYASVRCEYCSRSDSSIAGYVDPFISAVVDEYAESLTNSAVDCNRHEVLLRQKVQNGIERLGGSVTKLDVSVNWYA